MRDKNILLLAGLTALSGAALSTLLELPAAAASLLGALLALPIPWWAMRMKSLRQTRLADDHATAIAGAPLPLLLLDAEGHLLAFSRGLEQLTGISASARHQPMQALPRSWQGLIAELHAEALENGCSTRRHQDPDKQAGQAASFRAMSVTCVRLGGPDESAQLLFSWAPQAPAAPGPAFDAGPELAERKRAFLQTLIDVIPQPVYIKRMEDGIGRYLLVNDAFCASHNRTRESLIGCSASELFDPAHASTVVQEDRAVAAGTSIFREEQGKDAATGLERFLIVSKQSCLSPEGERVIVGTNFDVTPWRLAEREVQRALDRERSLRERTQSFVQRIIDVIPYPVHVKDAQSRYLIVNDAFVRERGCSREELLGQNPRQVVHIMTGERADAREEENQRAAISLQEDRAVLAGETIIKEEHNRHSVTGDERFRTVFKHACQDIEGQPAIVTAMFDITKWSVAERKLATALEAEHARAERIQAFLQRMIDVIPHPFFLKDHESRYILANEAHLQELRRSASEVIGHTSAELAADPARIQLILAEDQRVLAGEEINEERHERPMTGENIWADRIISKRRCLDVEGRPVIAVSHIDVTAHRDTERELQAALAREAQAREGMRSFLQSVIDVLPQEFYIKDAAGRIVMVNPLFLQRRSLTERQQAVGKTIPELGTDYLGDYPAFRDEAALEQARRQLKARWVEASEEDREVLAGKRILKKVPRYMHGYSEQHRVVIAKASCADPTGQPVIVCATYDVDDLARIAAPDPADKP